MFRRLDSSDIPAVARQDVGTQLANKLKQIIVPPRPSSRKSRTPTTATPTSCCRSRRRHRAGADPLRPAARASGCSRGTRSARIDRLYVAFEDKPYARGRRLRGRRPTSPTPGASRNCGCEVICRLAPGQPSSAPASHPRGLRAARLRPRAGPGLRRVPTDHLAAGGAASSGSLVARLGPAARNRRPRLRPPADSPASLFLRWGLLVLEPDRVSLIAYLLQCSTRWSGCWGRGRLSASSTC